jgi:IclR family transcriptional regulator, pca regulon regulatory protein
MDRGDVIDRRGVLFEYRTSVQIKIPRNSAIVNMTGDARREVGDRRFPEGMAGLAKGLAIIEAFSPHRTRLTVSDAAQLSGTSRASARRCLFTLTELGYLEFDGKYFRPQPRLLSLGAAYLGTRSLSQIAQPFLTAARDELRESISLAVLDNDAALFVARAEAERLVTTGISIGTRIELYCSATGRVLLSAWAHERLAASIKKAALRAAVRDAKGLGYATTDQELEIGLRSIAVPVTDSRGTIVAAMSASASSARVSIKQMVKSFFPVLRASAESLGRAL